MIDPALRDALASVSTATLSMQLLKHGYRHIYMEGVQPLVPGMRVVGPAFTLRYIPAREDLSTPEVLGRPDNVQRRAMEEAPAGSVLVIDARGLTTVGTMGDILLERLKQRGVAGVVTDGAVRDAIGCVDVGLPIWCSGPAAPAGITGHANADSQCPIGCGNVAVLPGDIMVGDDDGVVVVPQQIAEEIAPLAVEQERLEKFLHLRVKAGHAIPGTYPPNAETRAAYDAWVAAGEPGTL